MCLIKPESDEKSSAGKLFQTLTTRSVKNEDRAVQLERCLYSLWGRPRVVLVDLLIRNLVVVTLIQPKVILVVKLKSELKSGRVMGLL